MTFPPYKTDVIGVCWYCGCCLRPGCCAEKYGCSAERVEQAIQEIKEGKYKTLKEWVDTDDN